MSMISSWWIITYKDTSGDVYEGWCQQIELVEDTLHCTLDTGHFIWASYFNCLDIIWCVFHIFIFGWYYSTLFCKSCRYPSLYEIESSGWERVQEPGCGHAAAYSIARLCLCLAQHNTHKYFLLHVQIFSDCTYQYFLLGRGYVQSRYYIDNR